MLFSEKYAALIINQDSQTSFCEELTNFAKTNIIKIMTEFDAPANFFPNRYDGFEITTSVLQIAIHNFIDKKETSEFEFKINDYGEILYDNLYEISTRYLWDLIELQFEELSGDEKTDFQSSINAELNRQDIPWLLCDGHMTKIDAEQFEFNLKTKALELEREIKSVEPKFQAAYSELLSAIDYFNKGDYMAAITNAGKSYESVLKVVLGVDCENANNLTKAYIESSEATLPATMKGTGFRDKVLMSLPFVRNNSASAHGAGATSVVISKEFANLALNLAATLNTFLVEEYRVKYITKKGGMDDQSVSDDILPF